MSKKMIIVHQSDIKDCGPCCLQSIIRYYDGYVSIEKIREDAFTTNEGTTVYHLMKAAKKYGFDAIAKKYSNSQINNIKLPAIVHVKYSNGLTHFMCLYRILNGKVILMNPSKGKQTLEIKSFLEIFTGVVIELYPKNKIIYLQKKSSIYQLFFQIIKNNKKLCINLLLCGIGITITSILGSFHFKINYEYLSSGNYNDLYKIINYLFLTLLVFKIIFSFLKVYYENHINKNIDTNILSNFINHIFHLPLKVIENRTSGEIISRVSEINEIKNLFSQIFISGILDLLLSLVSIIVLFFINYKLSLILSLIIIVYIGVSLIINPYLYNRIKNNIDLDTEFNSTLIENINMITSIKNMNYIKSSTGLIENKLSELLYDNYNFTNKLNVINIIKESVCEIGLFSLNCYAFYLISINELNLITLIIFNTISNYFLTPIKNLVSLLPKYNFLRASFNKICDFIDLDEEKIGLNENFINGDIIYQNVSFSYNDYHKNINDLNLIIKKGEKILIKGKSGCGKSTMCKLLLRHYECLNGNIYINNKNIKDYSINTIRNNIIYVGQKENLLTNSIKNNILYGNKNYSKYEEICNVCCINEITDTRNFRHDYGIDNHCNISGGEKQRIVLARALMKKCEILILDEALSEVDIRLEEKIISNIKEKYPDITLIYISHKYLDNQFDRTIDLGVNYE